MTLVAKHLERLQTELEGELFVDNLSRQIYATDASVYQELPTAVAIPRSDHDIEALIKFALEHGIGLIPRTAGTSLAGQVVGSGIVVDVSKHFTRIQEINANEKWVRVEPGVIRDELNLALKTFGLMFGPETSTANRAMIGGMVGNNSCGSNSIVYGSTRDHVIEISGFLSDGTYATFGPISPDEIKAAKLGEGLEATIYRTMFDILNDKSVQTEIRQEFPKPEINRRNTGYAIDSLLDGAPFGNAMEPFNLCRLLAGSEGTLFFATSIKLRCQPLPPSDAGVQCIHFHSMDDALRAVPIAMRFHPWACELIDHLILEGAARNLDQKKNLQLLDGKPAAILVVEIRADNQPELLDINRQLQSELEAAQLGYSYPFLTGTDSQRIWDLRKSGLGVMGNNPGDLKPVACIEDVAVAIDDLPEYIREVDELLNAKYNVQCVHYAHAGAGEIHLRPVLNLKSPVDRIKFRNITSDVATLVKKFRGSLSGEHGDGRLRAQFIKEQIGARNFELLKRIKRTWDPNNIFNPGKIINAPEMNTSLRCEANQESKELDTIFDFSHQGGLLRAVEMCNGSGDCRKTHLTGGTMCPSYMASRDESDTTRARANVLRQAMTNPDHAKRVMNRPDVLQVLDRCLSCKGCKNECPSNVDMAKLKAEFLQSVYDSNGTPFRARLISNLPRLNRFVSRFPRFYNFLTSSRLFGSGLKRLAGFHPSRPMPQIRTPTFAMWFAKHRPHANAGTRGIVNMFCDEFTSLYEPEVGIAAVELLERLGWRVEIPSHIESGRASISAGCLRKARVIAKQNVDLLHRQVSSSKPLLGVEPSALLTLRDEYVDLLRGNMQQKARQLAEHCLLVDEFLDQQEIDPSRFEVEHRNIRLHGHCHQKALTSLASTVRMLQLPTSYVVRTIPSGCCGMAGSFGFEREHFELSQQIGELVLFPTIRDEPETSIIAATGISCRQQIWDGTGRRAFHPVQILKNALVD